MAMEMTEERLNPRVVNWSADTPGGRPEWVKIVFEPPDDGIDGLAGVLPGTCAMARAAAGACSLAGPWETLVCAFRKEASETSLHLLRTIEDFVKRHFTWRLPSCELPLGERTLIMGIVNVTPDSFSDGGRFFDPATARDHALALEANGADIVDIGGLSTRPGSNEVSLEEEFRRVVPVVEAVAKRTRIPISVDTYRASVAKAAIEAGAQIINDISGLTFDPEMAQVAAAKGVPVCVMHIKGRPRDMQKDPVYQDLTGEIIAELRRSIRIAEAAGLPRTQLAVDPGIGFGKTVAHNLMIIKQLRRFRSLGAPLLIGPSRKSFIGAVCEREVDQRIWGTAASIALSIAEEADIIRVHDVREMRDVARLTDAVMESTI